MKLLHAVLVGVVAITAVVFVFRAETSYAQCIPFDDYNELNNIGALPQGAVQCPPVSNPSPAAPGATINNPSPAAPGTPRAGVGSVVRLQNPLSGISTIPQLLAAILNIVVILAIPVIIFFIMLAGFKYVTARGNATQIQEASKALLYAVIGAVLILGATAIAQIVKNLVDAFR